MIYLFWKKVYPLFKDAIKRVRIDNNLSQDEFGKLFSIRKSTISNWELGKATPTYETLVKIANHFNVTTDYLLGIETPEKWRKSLIEAGILDYNDNVSYTELKNAIQLYKEYKDIIKKSTNDSTSH